MSFTLAIGLLALLGGPTAKTSIAWDQEVVIPVPECTRTFMNIPRESICLIATAPDRTGLHLFIALQPLRFKDEPARTIRHFLVSGGSAREMQPIAMVHSGVRALEASTDGQGRLVVVWVEQMYWDPQYHDETIYLCREKDGQWESPIHVPDEKGKVFVLDGGSLAVWSEPDGSLLVYWNDLREFHPGRAFLSVCDDGHIGKTYRRRFTADGPDTVEQVQRRGTFEPDLFRLLPRTAGEPDVLWSYAGVIKRSSRSTKGWADEEVVARCTSKIGPPSVLQVEIGPHAAEGALVAWACSGYEPTEPGTRKNHDFNDLYVTTFTDGRWRTGERLARNVGAFRWIAGDQNRAFLLLRERPPVTWPRDTTRAIPASLAVKTIERGQVVDSTSLSEHALGDVLVASSGPNDEVHIVYAEPITDSEAVLKYRHGSVDPHSSEPGR